MRPERASALGLLAAGLLAPVADARPNVRARSQQIRRQNAQDCLEDLEDVLDNAPTTSLWPATACDFTSTLSGAELTSNYASFRSRMASWYSDDLDDITKIERSCTQYVSVFDQIRYCYVTGPSPTPAASTTASASATAATTTMTTPVGPSTASRTSTGASSSPTSTGTSTPDPDGGGGLDPGAKAGLAIGIVLAVVLILFIYWKFLQRYRSTRLAEGSGLAMKGDAEPQMRSAAAIGGATAGAGIAAAAAARTKFRPPESFVYAYKSELNGESRPMSELEPAAATASQRPHPGVPELDPEPPTQLSELSADTYDPTANGVTPPGYISPITDANRSTLDTAVSPLSPGPNSMQTQGLGIPTGGDPSQEIGNGSASAPLMSESESQGGTVQYGWGRGWLRKD